MNNINILTLSSPSGAGLIFLDSRFHGNDNNGCFLIFYMGVKLEIGKNRRKAAQDDQIPKNAERNTSL